MTSKPTLLIGAALLIVAVATLFVLRRQPPTPSPSPRPAAAATTPTAPATPAPTPAEPDDSSIAAETTVAYNDAGMLAVSTNAVSVTKWEAPSAETAGIGTLIINSVPSNADVYVNNRAVGKTPCAVTGLSPLRPILVELKLDDYAPHSQRVQLAVGRETGLGVRLKPLRKGLVVISVPSGADVKVDGRSAGQTPLSLRALADDGEHTVSLSMAGYAPQEKMVKTFKDQAVVASFALIKTLGEAAFFSSEAGVEILSGDQVVGTTTTNASGMAVVALDMLEPGQHAFEARKPGFIPRQFAVNVGEGQTVNLKLNMEPEFAADYEVRTVDGSVYRGKLLGILDNGTVRIEVAPGQYRNLPADIISASGDIR